MPLFHRIQYVIIDYWTKDATFYYYIMKWNLNKNKYQLFLINYKSLYMCVLYCGLDWCIVWSFIRNSRGQRLIRIGQTSVVLEVRGRAKRKFKVIVESVNGIGNGEEYNISSILAH